MDASGRSQAFGAASPGRREAGDEVNRLVVAVRDGGPADKFWRKALISSGFPVKFFEQIGKKLKDLGSPAEIFGSLGNFPNEMEGRVGVQPRHGDDVGGDGPLQR
jgi:hypothetical protein